jgi:excisionase family DNA binding protein
MEEQHMLQQMEEQDRLVRKAETLERLGISESTYFRLIRAGVLRAVVVGRQSFRVRESDMFGISERMVDMILKGLEPCRQHGDNGDRHGPEEAKEDRR